MNGWGAFGVGTGQRQLADEARVLVESQLS